MATKKETIDAALQGLGCLGKAAPDEEVFVFRAQDMLAPTFIRKWALAYADILGLDHPKVQGALKIATRMRECSYRKLAD
jgi:hypothetical protein